MDLEEDNEGAGGQKVFPCLFYNEAGNEVDADQDQGVITPDPHKRFIDRPYAAPEEFNSGVNLDN